MNERLRELGSGLRQFAAILGWLFIGALLGSALATWQAPGSTTVLVASVLLLPATVVLGWMLMFPLALLMLPFMIPRFIRWLREPRPATAAVTTTERRPQATAAGWIFLVAAIPTSLIAGVIAGAPFWYLLGGVGYGVALRHSAALQEVSFE